jgi:ABC-2 type transport system permease protein
MRGGAMRGGRMKSSVAGHLILKDWRLNSPMIILSIVGGGIALMIVQLGGSTPFILGSVFFFISLIICGSLLPGSNIVNERKKQTLPFLMSLPISSVQYGTAKLASTFGMFLVPWLTLVGAAVWFIAVRHVLPNGAIPMALILALLPFVGFCITTGAALISESEGSSIAATAIVNSSYWLVWYILSTRFPELARDWTARTAIWSPAVLNILAGECALIVLILVLTLYVQSRKRDFV